MAESGQIRINELARELEIKAKVLIEYLPEIGIAEKKTHSSSLENEQADRVRKHFHELAAAEAVEESAKQAKAAAAKVRPAPRPAVSGVPATLQAPAPATVASGTAKPAIVPPAAPGVKVPIRPAAAASATSRPAGAPVAGAPSGAPHPTPAPRSGPPSTGAPTTVPSQRPGAPPPQRAPIVTRPAAAGGSATPARPGSAPGQGQRPPGGYSRPGAPPRPGGAPSGYRPAAGQGAPRPGGAPMRPPQRPGGRPGQPMTGRPGSAAGQAPKAEPGKPLYVRKPPARAKPTIEKRFAEGERKLHPVRARSGAAAGRGVGHAEPVAPVVREPRPVTITEGITVRELAEKLDIRAKELLKNLLDRGVFASINQALDIQTATGLAEAFSGVVEVVSFEEQMAHEDVSKDDKSERLTPRAPVVTVMGHVDHGKTSLLDAIRSTDVAGGESGGITQHIGASDVHIDGKRIVFIDTPGHEAFTRMRARGAKVTDIVVLVVGADDGVMPQTEEAIDHARAAKVPIIVALNKVDKPDAQPERVKRQLADHGLMPEDWGGDTVMVEVSAKTKKNVERLLEMILLVGDLRELKSNPASSASGTVLESRVDKGRGPVATVLVQNGTLSVGDVFICGAVYGKVRALYDDRGQPVKSAGPSTPVEVLGLQGIPDAGDQFYVADEAKARHIVEYRQSKLREATLAKSASSRLTLDQLHEQLKAGEVKDLPIVIKGDVQGSVEVLSEMLPKLSNDQVKLKIIHASVGAVSETDVLLASASSAIVIAFNVRPERKASDLAQQEGVDIRLHTIIYEVVDEIKKAMVGLLAPVIKEQYLGRAEVRDTFRVKGVGMIAGCHIQDGIVKRDAEVRVLRDNVVVYTGRVSSLRRFKDDVNEVRAGFECGISISNFADVKVGDILECFAMERTAHPGANA
ncbi:MAG TPA: translation initiation factor IF-2 [Candidatus Acidoferrales bacterium]|nr:translation initiation factor IF-2 [Candidatus Acidoferrales bacterium]